jgi:hypothetical protein
MGERSQAISALSKEAKKQKVEARNPKLETNSNDQKSQNLKTIKSIARVFENLFFLFWISIFGFIEIVFMTQVAMT